MLYRIGYAGFGFFGFCTLAPNIMMSANGSAIATRKACVGLLASTLMISSGLMGVFHHTKYIPIKYASRVGMLGISMQFLAFIIYF